MSGGSMDYLYSKLLAGATFDPNTPERRAFFKHIEKVAQALHDIEWVDSGDYSKGMENEAIRACISEQQILDAMISWAREVESQLRKSIEQAEETLRRTQNSGTRIDS